MNQPSLQGEYAGFLSRAAAFVTDMIIISLIVLVINWFVPAMIKQVIRFDLQNCAASTRFTISFYSCTAIQWGLIVFSILFAPLYTIFFWIFAGQTPGKYLFGLRVVRLNGNHMNLLVSVIRYLGYAVCIVSLGLGFLNVLINNRRQGWHDMFARTCVVYSWEARQYDSLLARVQQKMQLRRG